MLTDVHGRPWIATMSFDTSGDFCKENYKFDYDGRNVEIVRGGVDSPHNIHIESSIGNYSAIESVLKFFSELSWLFDERVEYGSFMAGYGKGIIGTHNKSYSRYGNAIDLIDYEPMSLNEKQRLALSIYREGNNSTSKYYAFLCYYKIINITNHTRRELIDWINKSFERIDNKDIIGYVKEKNIENIGEHLYISGRCAIAHASYSQNSIIRNADNPEDNFRINKEVDFMKQFAKHYLIKDLKIPTRWDIASEVMLKYFYNLFGKDLLNKIIKSTVVDVNEFPEIPLLKLGVYEPNQLYENLNDIKVKVVKAGLGIVILSNEHQNLPLYFKFEIDFVGKDIPNEKVMIKIRKHAKPIHKALFVDYFNLWKALLINGRLEILDSEKNSLITRLWAYIPVNIDVDASINNYELLIIQFNKEIDNDDKWVL